MPASDPTGSKPQEDYTSQLTQEQFDSAFAAIARQMPQAAQTAIEVRALLGVERDFALYVEFFANGEVR
jgi:hypothetical protein